MSLVQCTPKGKSSGSTFTVRGGSHPSGYRRSVGLRNTLAIEAGASIVGLTVEIHGQDNRVHIEPGCRLVGVSLAIHGNGNEITFGRGSRYIQLTTRVEGDRACGNFRGDGNLLCFGPSGSAARMSIKIQGSGNRFELGEDVHVTKQLDAHMHGFGSRIRIGAHTSLQSATLVANEIRSAIEIGEDCMLADGVEIATSDSHPIFDVVTRARINPARRVAIGFHVWLGAGTRLMKGAEIGDGCIVGAGAIITRPVILDSGELAHNALIVGASRLAKTGVTWEREMTYGPADDLPAEGLTDFPDARAIDAFHRGHHLGRRAAGAARAGRVREAIDLYRRTCQSYRDAIAAKADHAYAYCACGGALGKLGRLHAGLAEYAEARNCLEEALTLFDEAIELLPGYADALGRAKR